MDDWFHNFILPLSMEREIRDFVSFSDGIVQLTLKYQHYSCSEFSQGRDNTVPTQWQLTAHATTWLLVTQFYTVLPVS